LQDSKYFVLSENHEPAMYSAYLQQRDYTVNLHFVVRVNGDPLRIVKTVTGTLSHLDPTAAVETKAMSQAMGLALLPSQGAAIIGSTAVLGLVLAAIGLAGLLLYIVARRTREIGLRVALGATPGEWQPWFCARVWCLSSQVWRWDPCSRGLRRVLWVCF
jgi:putative ABC transport system permease protein